MIKSINAPFIKLLNDYNEMFYYLNRGFVIVLFSKYIIVVGISKSSNPPISKKEENSNISFIRRRNKLESFILEEIVIGKEAPAVCPVCSHPQSYFEIKAENY